MSELDERVSWDLPCYASLGHSICGLQAKEHDIYDTAPFLRSKLFAANGYKLKEGSIEKAFKQGDE